MIRIRRFVASFLVLCMMGLSLPMQAHAGIVATDALVAADQRVQVNSMLERADVQDRLQALGVQPADVQSRVAALSDDEVSKLAAQMDSLPAGGDGLVGALVLIFVVLLVTDLMGLTHVFPFTSRR